MQINLISAKTWRASAGDFDRKRERWMEKDEKEMQKKCIWNEALDLISRD